MPCARGAEIHRPARRSPQTTADPGAADEAADLENMAVADGWTGVVGSHELQRKHIKPNRDHAENAKRLAKMALDGMRRLLACLPIETDTRGKPCLAIPGKDNGLDIEGLAVGGRRQLPGLRGPVLRGCSALLEIAVEPRGDQLHLLPLDDSGRLLRNHFLLLEGLGIHDLHFSGDDLGRAAARPRHQPRQGLLCPARRIAGGSGLLAGALRRAEGRSQGRRAHGLGRSVAPRLKSTDSIHLRRPFMSDNCGSHGCAAPPASQSPRYRRVLWAALVINVAMFAIELAGGLQAGSVSLLADAVDFFGDAANYGLSLLVLGMALRWRARAALVKGLSMGAFGIFVLAQAAWSAAEGTVPEAATMGAIGALALLANVSVAAMLYAWREGDANMRSVWLCSRNDAIGNVAVMAAAVGVVGTGTGWPDLAVAAVMGVLALTAARSVIQQARAELRLAPTHA